jgi:hypothetical protein
LYTIELIENLGLPLHTQNFGTKRMASGSMLWAPLNTKTEVQYQS